MLEFLMVIIFIGSVIVLYVSRLPSIKGARGEARVNSFLRSNLNSQQNYILSDLTLPTTGGTTQIDHIVLSPNGVFVIETKNMSGWIFGDANQSRWTQVFRRQKFQFQNPIRQNYKHIKVVQDLLGIEMRQIYNVVVFVGSAEPRTIMPENILWDSGDLLRYIRSKQPICFFNRDLQSFMEKLKNAALEKSRKTSRAHVGNVRKMLAERQNDKTKCPRCRANMVERTNHKTGEKFLGCSRYPKCKGTREL